ncbi:MAG: hypothetical protein WD708_10585 [Kiritimatiellia bacterium]
MLTFSGFSFRRAWVWLFLCVCGGSVHMARADRFEYPVGATDEEIVEVSISSFTESVPAYGVVTLKVEVRNHRRDAGQWMFRFEGFSSWDRKKEILSERRLRVEGDSVRTVQWEIPVFPGTETRDAYQPRLNVVVSGPGARGASRSLLNSGNAHSGNSNPTFVAVSPRLQVTRDDWNMEGIRQEIQNSRYALTLSQYDPELFPTSPTGLAGIDVFLISEEEWREFSPLHPLFHRWMTLGGKVIIMTDDQPRTESVGSGGIEWVAHGDEVNRIPAQLMSASTPQKRLADPRGYLAAGWSLRRQVPDISRPFGLLMVVVLVIALLLGPLNLWSSFRKNNSLQVIWTTPALSVGLSVLVGIGILFSDGFGGKGQRSQVVLLLPEHQLEVTVQEQVSRTGVLLNRGFTLPEATEIYPVATTAIHRGERRRYVEQAGGTWNGDWFANRRIQAQVLQRSRNSRSRVSFVEGGDSPSILSTVDATFKRMLIRDAQGRMWWAEDVHAGAATPLRAAGRKESAELLAGLSTRESEAFPDRSMLQRHGWFYAEAVESDRYIDTLTSIRWRDRPVWFMGPLSEGGRP